ncbi:MAG: AMP-binding protein, partial [bacterium]|nr:AMP-binding protein [bacterium]
DQAGIDQLLAELGGVEAGSPEACYALSPDQQGMLFHSLYAPESGVYVVQLSVRLRGELDVAIFAQAWQQVVDRHATLRSSFHWQALDKPVQVVHRKPIERGIERGSWRELSPADERLRLRSFLSADRDRGFELGTAPLMRLALFELGEGDTRFIWSFHHLCLDGWSQARVLQEVFRCYEALSQGRSVSLPPTRPYREYIAWLERQDIEEAGSYWRRVLAGFTAPTPLVGRRRDDAPGGHRDFREVGIRLSAAAGSALRSLARDHQLTLNTLVQGAWALLLGRYSGHDDIVFGVTVAGRPAELPGVESMVGLFITTLPVRVEVKQGELLVPWLERLQSQQAELRSYEHSPLDQVQKWSGIPLGQPLFEHILVFENYPVDSSLNASLPGLEISEVQPLEQTNYPLTVYVTPAAELDIKMHYDSRRFEASAIRRLLGHFRELLRGLVADPRRRLSELALLRGGERQQILHEWNDTAGELPRQRCLHELFAEQVERTPEAVAVVCPSDRDEQVRTLSYRELNRRADRLADALRERGAARPGVLVGICVERSPEMVVGLLGILKAGG